MNRSLISYWYEGFCPESGELLRLPRNQIIELIARELMTELAKDNRYNHEGKMYGVLLAENFLGEQKILRAFSGLLWGKNTIEGWVPSIPGRDKLALEEIQTLRKLDQIKQQIFTLKQLPEREEYQVLSQKWETCLNYLTTNHQKRKQNRHHQRQALLNKLTGDVLNKELEKLNIESQRDGIERRKLKQKRNRELQPLQQLIAQKNAIILELKKQRKEISSQLQTKINDFFLIKNFTGKLSSLRELIPTSLLAGTGDCCAPKLLHYAATNHLKPLAMAEFWWGIPSKNGDKVPGQFYPACAERCQPLMGFLLSGLPNLSIPKKANYNPDLIYEDQWIIAVNKPPGLLSIPGRYYHTFDSVLIRLRNLFPNDEELMTVHRLDQETSGILLLARDHQTHRQLSKQFQNRQVHKIYESIVSGCVTVNQGAIDLPVWGDPSSRPCQKVDWQRGKPSVTHFQVIKKDENYTRVEFIPITGRTHQIRVHTADPQGLNRVILGDRLYGCCMDVSRLYLHARELSFEHPYLRQTFHLQSKTPF
ncbi:MAG: pseudouridine synthase [cyanobacterium endosymbiont of Rhopalodia musculus]|uniref:RluA family pseudouridine synthase n=1 Tax=cyanobacterium endosymbiont of Epithemia clementina EcSB TaxID=3034674 RepID=UPI00248068D7|nr:pseudouridine synthase [cyanobacterium endosymbiont of Epithemia clementina EcSB]WGT66978.1 pseudouridine synthase [cyanobacterium endosymbiont of Epithemia clementina EcSB]